MWWDKGKILSYNKLYNYVLGNRGGGKSFGCKMWCIDDYVKNGNQFVWVRRRDSEFELIKPTFFSDIIDTFPDKYESLDIKIKKDIVYIDGEQAGYLIPLSMAYKYKSVAFPRVTKIIYDEFVIDNASLSYLKNEPLMFNDLFETIARKRDNVRALFLANSISSVNPYFTYYHLEPSNRKTFNVYNDCVVEFFADEQFIKEKKATRFGRMIAGTRYGDYAIENQFLKDTSDFLGKKTENARFLLAMKYENQMLGFWIDYNENRIFVNDKYDGYSRSIYSLTKDDHEEKTLLVKSLNQQPSVRMVFTAFNDGLLRFENQRIKQTFFDVVGIFQR